VRVAGVMMRIMVALRSVVVMRSVAAMPTLGCFEVPHH
jgi:hypothetical protein